MYAKICPVPGDLHIPSKNIEFDAASIHAAAVVRGRELTRVECELLLLEGSKTGFLVNGNMMH
jgi:hypothetical protein